MIQLRRIGHLANLLSTSAERLTSLLVRADDFYEQLTVRDPGRKDREVVQSTGQLRRLQRVFYQRVLLDRLHRNPHSHGGVPGRDIFSNLRPHLGQRFLFTADISNFYPSVHRVRVHRLFERLGCTADVAGTCTRLCTYDHHLAQGLVTSPILADQLMGPVDRRIGILCGQQGLVYTRFVDDIAVSGPFDLEPSGIPDLIERILRSEGFEAHPAKRKFGRPAEGAVITNLRFPRGHPDVRREYLDELRRQLDDAASLAAGGAFRGPYYTQSQLWGRVVFVCRVNPGRRRTLMRKLAAVDWESARHHAQERGLVAFTRLVFRGNRLGSAAVPGCDD